MKRTMLVLVAATLAVAACGSDDNPTTQQAASEPAEATTPQPEATTTTAEPEATTTEPKPDCTDGAVRGMFEHRRECLDGEWVDAPQERPTTTTAPPPPPPVPVDPALAWVNAQAAGVPAEAICPTWPTLMPPNGTRNISCTIVNPDLSEGTWAFTLNADISVSPPAYTETKAAPPPPLTRDQCVDTPEQGQFQKDSRAYLGQCLHFWASVFQFDANTGPCSFLASYGSAPHDRNYEFGDGIVRIDGGIMNCGLLGPVVDDSLVEVWAKALDVESYSTTIGGTNTYTVFEVVDIAVYA